MRVSREANGSSHDVFQSGDEKRRITDGRHHPEDVDTELFGIFARFDIDFVKRLDVLGHE